ncbi:protein LIFEGUARD 4-like [Salvia divinorum]
MSCFSQKHPWNYVVLFLFTFTMAFMVGACSSQRKGYAALLLAGLTLLVTVGLTVFTFAAAKRAADFSSMVPFLFFAILLFMAFGIIWIIFPLGRVREQVIGCVVFSGFIIYDTGNLIKRFNYHQYIDAACCLYMDSESLLVHSCYFRHLISNYEQDCAFRINTSCGVTEETRSSRLYL